MGPGQQLDGQVMELLRRTQRRVAELEMENRELRRQLDELRRGVGITVTIHGRTVPLTPLAPAGASQPTGGLAFNAPAPRTHRPPMPAPSLPTSGTPTPQAAPPSGTLPTPTPPFPEEAWLTGSLRAVRGAPATGRTGGAVSQPYKARPSQQMTPSWLREDPLPALPMETPVTRRTTTGHISAPEPRETRHPTPGPGPRPPDSRHATPGPRPRTPSGHLSRASASYPGSTRMRTLAQLTGHQTSARSDEHSLPHEQNPFANSFVLG